MKLSVRILIAFSIIIFLSLADSYTSFLLSQKVERNTQFLSGSEAVIRNSNRTHRAIIEMQSAFRGFLLTNDPAFLESYERGMKLVPPLLAQQRKMVEHRDFQVKTLDSITTLHNTWLDYSRSMIDSRQKYGTSSEAQKRYEDLFVNKFRKQVGKKLNDDISTEFQEFDRAEYRIRNHHRDQLIESIDTAHTFSLIFLSLTIIIGVTSTWYIISTISKRIATMVRVAENISQGKFGIVDDTRNDELTSLSKSLNIMSEKLSKNIHELESRNAELNKFAYVVSHDLKAPVRGIHNVIKWIKEDLGHEISPEMRRYLDIIPQRTTRMENLINGLLDYARISHKAEDELVDVNALVHDIVDSYVPRNFKVHIDLLPKLFTQRIRLEQVFSNLISNAVKYTQREDAELSILCKEFSNFYQFTVKDNGIGIEPEFHNKIFEIFQTLREKNEKESTGVGLAIVRKIIEEERGTISLRSAANEGSEFSFTWIKTATS